MTPFQVHAFNLYDSINIKNLRSALGGKIIGTSPQELALQYGESSYLFVYRFGCVVFFNMSTDEIERETAKLKNVLGNGVSFPTTETYQVHVGDFPIRVEFEHLEIKKLTLEHLRLISMTVGQSAGLEYFELASDRLLSDTISFMQSMAVKGRIPIYRNKNLMKIIGSTASTRQQIISNLSVLDPPDETWKSKELEKIYKELQTNFDIDIRFKTLDRKLTLIQDNIELLADLASKSRFMVLEALIVILILLELFIAVGR